MPKMHTANQDQNGGTASVFVFLVILLQLSNCGILFLNPSIYVLLKLYFLQYRALGRIRNNN